jgi:hypothetical protein
MEKNLRNRLDFQNTSRSTAAVDPKIGRVQKLFPAPCRRGESPPEVFFIAMCDDLKFDNKFEVPVM